MKTSKTERKGEGQNMYLVFRKYGYTTSVAELVILFMH